MRRRLLPAKEIVKSWCHGHRSPSQITRLFDMATADELLILLWQYPRNDATLCRFELLERFFLETGKEQSPYLEALFLGTLRDSLADLIHFLEENAAAGLMETLACDRIAELALRQGDGATRLQYEAELAKRCCQQTREFFQVRTQLRQLDWEIDQGNLPLARAALSAIGPLIDHALGYDILECQEDIARLNLETAEGDPDALAGYLALQRDARLFEHDRALITLRAADVLSQRHQFASSLALRLDLLHDEAYALPPRMRRSAILSLASDLISGGEQDAAIIELRNAQESDTDECFRARAVRLEAMAQIRAGDTRRAQILVDQFNCRTEDCDRAERSLQVLIRVCLLRAQGESAAAIDTANSYLSTAKQANPSDPWLPLLARERVRILRESNAGDPALVMAAQSAVHIAAVAQDPESMRDVYFTLAMHYSDKAETSDKAIEACRDAERCARTIMETLAADRDVLFRMMPSEPRNKTVVSALLGRLTQNARRGLKDLFELIRSLVRQSQSANELLGALQSSQRHIARILDTLPIVFWTSFGAARGFALGRTDGAVREMLGHSAETLQANKTLWLDSIHVDDKDAVFEALGEVERTLGAHTVEFRRRAPGGRSLWIEMQIRPIIGESHEDGTLYGIMADVTERQQLQQSAIRNKKIELLGHVVNNVTHEFNNVLGGILGAATLLAETLAEDSDNLELVDAIEHSALRGRDLTAKLSALTTSGSTKPTQVDLIAAVNDAVELARSMVASRFTIEVIAWEESLPVLCSRESLTRCLLDLIRNAEESDPADEKIVLRLGLEEGRAIVAVEDLGCGMDGEVARQALDPFFTTKDKNLHQGLGLTMADKIAHEADAKLTVRANPRQGTIVTLSMPLLDGPIDNQIHEESRSLLLSRGGKLLLIDDDPQVLKVSRAILERAGFDVVTAGDGQEGLDEFDKEPDSWSLVISDIRMPRVDGIAVMKALRKSNQNLPILLMTGYSETSPYAIADKDKCLDVIHKPFTAGSFLERAALLLGPSQ